MEIVWNPLDAATTLFDINWITDFSPRFFFISLFFFYHINFDQSRRRSRSDFPNDYSEK